MSWQNNTSLAKNWGIFGWNYNRTNFKYDQTLRWQRYTSGRKQAMAQIDMFREDIADLSGISTCKLKVYGPIYGIVTTVCVTVLVEGRSGLKFPGPPVLISGIYLQCLGVGMCFVILAAWLLFHSAMRAQMACVQLRTRLVRVPVPTQRQLDGSRKLLSTYEEQGLYDMFRIPFVMPNGANSPEHSDEEEEAEEKDHKTGYSKGGIPGCAHKIKSKVKQAHETGKTSHNAKMPGFTPGVPGWYDKELEDRDAIPEASPSGQGMSGLEEPYFHFEALRNAQKDWWGCEAYMRVAFLYGMIHLIMAFSYWITLHNIAELGMIWCSNMGAAGLTAGTWLIFRMDVLPQYGGAFPVEIGGPFVTSIAMGLLYSQQYTQTMIDIGRGVAILIVIMHILLTFRMYMIAKPSMGKAHHRALEAGGRLFNRSGSCEAPSWLPTAFQHVMYMVAPPKTEEQLDQELQDRDNASIAEDPLAKVDMTPWHYLRTMIFVVGLGWSVQLCGRAVEAVMGERMLMTNPGMPPWTRAGQWYGWEHGAITSKHYAHVTPQRGHWGWQRGWGPQGQQELWASDVFGFAPEADAWWAEDEGPEPRAGIAGVGENTWATGRVAYGQGEAKWGSEHIEKHDFLDSGGHRRLTGFADAPPRPVVPLPVQWPNMLEPDHMACSPSSQGLVAVLTTGGLGALVPAGTVVGEAAGEAVPFTLGGLLELGMAHSVTWGQNSLLVVTGSGQLAGCPTADLAAGFSHCERLSAPPLPESFRSGPAMALDVGSNLRAAVSKGGGRVALLELVQEGMDSAWQEVGTVDLPHQGPEIVAITASADHLLVSVDTGAAYRWSLRKGLPTTPHPDHDVPMVGQRTWQSACVLPDDKIIRLASTWQPATDGARVLLSELVL